MAKKPASADMKNTANGREERLKAALKANLARRKAQARDRARASAIEQNGGPTPEQDKDD